jgi:hypothetical protein
MAQIPVPDAETIRRGYEQFLRRRYRWNVRQVSF